MNKVVKEPMVPQCIECKKIIHGKPWITVAIDDTYVYSCRYLCSKYLSNYVGKNYFSKIVNKEDFNHPIPISCNYKMRDITCNFDGDKIRQEINDEDERIRMLEEEYMLSQSDEYSDEDI
jgi:hypothetical protein